MDAYILIGNTNTRKASVLRSLTGCFNRSIRDVLLQGAKAPVRFYARVGALQVTETEIEDFKAEVLRSRCQAALFCLSPDGNSNSPAHCPGAAEYVAGFRALGWRIKAVAVLGQNGGGVRATNLRQYPHAPTAPVNATAREIRAQFGWV